MNVKIKMSIGALSKEGKIDNELSREGEDHLFVYIEFHVTQCLRDFSFLTYRC